MTHSELMKAHSNDSKLRIATENDRHVWRFVSRPDSDPSARQVWICNVEDPDWDLFVDYRDLEIAN